MASYSNRKCGNCRRSFQPVKDDQIYCSHKCRQGAYRKRLGRPKRRAVSPERPLSPAVCFHCQGSFWAKTSRAVFCSTSCRSLAHRYRRSAISDALMLVYGVPHEKAADLVETQPLKKLYGVLAEAGLTYSYQTRRYEKFR